MSDDVRWVVQSIGTGCFYTGLGWDTDFQHALRWEHEVDALRTGAREPAASRIRSLRRVPAKRHLEVIRPFGCPESVLDHPEPAVWLDNRWFRCRELPPEPSDRWELVP